MTEIRFLTSPQLFFVCVRATDNEREKTSLAHPHANLSSLLLSETKLSHSDKVKIGGTPSMATMEVLSAEQCWTIYGSYMGVWPHDPMHSCPSVLLTYFIEFIKGQLNRSSDLLEELMNKNITHFKSHSTLIVSISESLIINLIIIN